MNQKLKKCPFCGAEADIATICGNNFSRNKRYFAYCSEGCVDLEPVETFLDAVNCWNTRSKRV